MFQLIGSLLAFFAIFSAVVGSPIAGAVFALLTFAWAVFAKPTRRYPKVRDENPWGAIYEVPFSR